MNRDVSVVVPAYNRFSILVRVIDSVLAQTLPVREVIVVDDGSRDETEEQMPRTIAGRPGWQGMVRYIRQENQGQSAALNRGIEESRSEWLAVAAHDDLWLPWKLEWQFRALENAPGAELCFTDAWFMNNPHMKSSLFRHFGKDLTGPTGTISCPTRLIAAGNHGIWVQTVLARREVVNRIGGFDSFLRFGEDDDFLFRMSLQTPFCYVSMPMVLIDRSPADIRHTEEALNWHKLEFRLRMNQHRYETQLRLSDGLSSDIRRNILSNLRSNQSHWATYYLKNSEYLKARSALRNALGYENTVGTRLKWMLTLFAPKMAQRLFTAHDQGGGPRVDRTSWRTASPASK